MPARLDRELADRGLARSRSHARQLIDSGVVWVNGNACRKPSEQIAGGDHVRVTATDRYVSRAAHKLLGALDDTGARVEGRALDAGSATGGFTQVLLERGCELVYAVDVGHDQLHHRLKSDPRVRPLERVNIVDLDLDVVDRRPVDLVVADVSFISLRKLLQTLIEVLRTDGVLLAMVKPQFEVGPHHVGRDGVVRSPMLRRSAVAGVMEAAAELGWRASDVVPSRVPGPAGNREFFLHCVAAQRDGGYTPGTPDGKPPTGDTADAGNTVDAGKTVDAGNTVDLDAVDWGA